MYEWEEENHRKQSERRNIFVKLMKEKGKENELQLEQE
jgi:hypothetical protein